VSEQKEKWIQWVALTTTVLAVSAAISSLKGGGFSTQIQLKNTQEANRWAFYQSKSLKQNLAELERESMAVLALEARTPEGRKQAEASLARATAEAQRYDAEKKEIRVEAEKLAAEQAQLKRHGGSFGLAVMLLQIAIMMSSVGALIRKPVMWYVGLLFGLGGLGYMANGFWGLF
jgi:regulator of protease activity HflC (stomatin/prohibitin superfamily)